MVVALACGAAIGGAVATGTTLPTAVVVGRTDQVSYTVSEPVSARIQQLAG